MDTTDRASTHVPLYTSFINICRKGTSYHFAFVSANTCTPQSVLQSHSPPFAASIDTTKVHVAFLNTTKRISLNNLLSIVEKHFALFKKPSWRRTHTSLHVA